MARRTYSTPCDLALNGEDHDPHDYPHADQMFWCDGEGVESTPVNEAGIDWLDEIDWTKVDWDKVVAADHRRQMAEALAPKEEVTLWGHFVDWCDYSPAVIFYSVITMGFAFAGFLFAMTYLLSRSL